MFNICVFHKYKVIQKAKGSTYISTDFEGDSKFEDYSFEETYEMEGGKLLEVIVNKLQNADCMDITIDKDRICFSFFNPHTGSSSDEDLFITLIEEFV